MASINPSNIREASIFCSWQVCIESLKWANLLRCHCVYLWHSLEKGSIVRHDGCDIENGSENDTVPALPECSIMGNYAPTRTLQQNTTDILINSSNYFHEQPTLPNPPLGLVCRGAGWRPRGPWPPGCRRRSTSCPAASAAPASGPPRRSIGRTARSIWRGTSAGSGDRSPEHGEAIKMDLLDNLDHDVWEIYLIL